MPTSKLSDTDKSIMNDLVDFYLDTTVKVLQKEKHVIPMAVCMETNGRMSFNGLGLEDEALATDRLLDDYRQLLRRTSSEHKACLLGYDVKLKNRSDYSDALAVEVEVKDGTQVFLHIPYRFTGLRKKLEWGDIERAIPVTQAIYSEVTKLM